MELSSWSESVNMILFIKLVFYVLAYVTLATCEMNCACLSPEGIIGQCVSVIDCIPIFQIVSSGRNWTSDAEKQYLSNSFCGHQNKQPLVCCTEVDKSSSSPLVSTSTFSTQSSSRLETGQQLPTKATTSAKCGVVQNQNRIVGGVNTGLGELPWVALIKYVKMPNHVAFHCSATLISHNFVITAAHCIYGKSIYKQWIPKEIRLGEWDMRTSIDCIGDVDDFECADPSLDVLIRRIIPHQYFMSEAKNQYHDIALIQMDQAVEFTDFIKPICLPPLQPASSTSLASSLVNTLTNQQQGRGSNYRGHKFLVAGWGVTETTKRSAILKKTTLNEVDLKVCAAIYKKEKLFIMSNQLCAQANERDTCQGDSGAALMSIFIDKTNPSQLPYWYIAGIVSYGMTPCANPEWPGVYTRITDYVNWIEDTIEKSNAGTSHTL